MGALWFWKQSDFVRQFSLFAPFRGAKLALLVLIVPGIEQKNMNFQEENHNWLNLNHVQPWLGSKYLLFFCQMFYYLGKLGLPFFK